MNTLDTKFDLQKVNDLESPNRIRVLETPQVRISSASLTRLNDNAGRYLIAINKNSADRGLRTLTPIGGGIKVTNDGQRELQKLIGITRESFEGGNDLRFMLRGSAANTYREWFMARINRETDPRREIFEELVDENPILSHADLRGLSYSLSGFHAELGVTSRAGQVGQNTLRLLEIFDVKLMSNTMIKLEQLSQQPKSLVRFVTKQEIINRSTIDGVDIGSVALSLLNPQPTIQEFI